jgi:hypothetical protein
VGGTTFKFSSFGAIFNMIQITALFSSFRLNWPAPLLEFYNILSSLNFNIDLFAPECAANISYYEKWWLTMSFPIIFIAFLWLTCLVIRVVMIFKPGFALAKDQVNITPPDMNVKRYNMKVCHIEISVIN